MSIDKITIERIKTLHPKIRKEVSDMYNYVNEKLLGKGVRLRFAYTYRTPEEQDKLFKQKPKVTNAKAWQSIHNYGLALDIVLLYDLDNNLNSGLGLQQIKNNLSNFDYQTLLNQI